MAVLNGFSSHSLGLQAQNESVEFFHIDCRGKMDLNMVQQYVKQKKKIIRHY